MTFVSDLGKNEEPCWNRHAHHYSHLRGSRSLLGCARWWWLCLAPWSTALFLQVVGKMILLHIRQSQISASFSSVASVGSSFILSFTKYFWAPTTFQALFQMLILGTQQCKSSHLVYRSVPSTLAKGFALIFPPHCYLQCESIHGKEMPNVANASSLHVRSSFLLFP